MTTDDSENFTIGDLDVSPRGGTKILRASTSGNPNPALSNQTLTIDFDEISMGQKVIITYTRSTPIAISGSLADTDQFSAVVTPVGAGTAPTIKGGMVREKAGSGQMEISPVAIGVNDKTSFTLTYTASTDLDKCYFSD